MSFIKQLNISKKELFILIFTSLIVMSFFIYEEVGGDTFFHLATGKYIYQTYSIPKTDVFSFTAFGEKWIPHGWLGGLVIFIIYNSLGEIGLKLFLSILALITFVILFLTTHIYYKVNFYLNLIISALVFFIISYRWPIRPEIFSYLLIVLEIFIIQKFIQTKKIGNLFILIPLFLLWGNLHGGFVLFGLGVIILFIIGLLIKLLINRQTIGLSEIRNHIIVPLIIFLIISFFVSLLNPYFFDSIFYSLKVKPINYQEINEWFSVQKMFFIAYNKPYLIPFSIFFLSFSFIIYILLFLLFIVTFLLKRINHSHIDKYPLVFLFLLLPPFSLRLIPLTFLVTSPIFIFLFNYFLKRKNILRPKFGYFKLLPIVMVVLILPILFTYFLISKEKFLKQKNTIPSKAADFLRENNIYGNVFTDLLPWGQYLTWEFYPNTKIFIDGRFDVFDENNVYNDYKLINNPTQGTLKKWQNLVDNYPIDYFLVMNSDIHNLPKVLSRYDNWQLIYYDDIALIYVKKKVEYKEIIDKFALYAIDLLSNFDFRKGMEEKAIEEFRKIINKDSYAKKARVNLSYLYVTQSKEEQAKETLEELLNFDPHYYAANVNLANILVHQGQYLKAEKLYLEALKSPEKDALAFKNLSMLYKVYFHNEKKADYYFRKYEKFSKIIKN